MKVFLMYQSEDFDFESELPENEEALTQDLELTTLCGAMAAGDKFLFEIAARAVLVTLPDPEAIRYRQRVLADCVAQPAIVRQIYALANEGVENERKVGWYWSKDSPGTILHRAVQVLEFHLDVLTRLRRLADEHAEKFQSDGFTRFFDMLRDELDDEYLEAVDHHLKELRFKRGVLSSVELGKGNKGRSYIVRTQREQSWLERLAPANRSTSLGFTIPDRDESGFRALEDIRGRGINLVADALARSADHVKSFFRLLQAELAFYIGCRNLHQRLAEKGEPTCFPVPLPADEPALDVQALYDVCLSLQLDERVVGNSVHADHKALVMITGANQGGKSTFLRSIGVASLMMQCGMFVGAEAFSANVCDGVFTHYKREEDAGMVSGKLDEELARMSEIADQIRPNSILLCNESFASTNEREGSEIARQVVRAMLQKRIKVFFVTHMFDLAHGLYADELNSALFLRAERQSDGRRTFKLCEGEPLPTSYGKDSYMRIFGPVRDATTGERSEAPDLQLLALSQTPPRAQRS